MSNLKNKPKNEVENKLIKKKMVILGQVAIFVRDRLSTQVTIIKNERKSTNLMATTAEVDSDLHNR